MRLVSISLSHMVKYDPVIILLSLIFLYIVITHILSLSMALQPLWTLAAIFQFLDLYTVRSRKPN
jgi:hypothetical protein